MLMAVVMMSEHCGN